MSVERNDRNQGKCIGGGVRKKRTERKMETSNAHLVCTVILMVYSVDVVHNACTGLSFGSNTVAKTVQLSEP